MTAVDELVLTDEQYSVLMNLASVHNGSHEYDFLYVDPHHGYFMLEPTGLIEIKRKDPKSLRVRIAKLTKAGREYVDSHQERRKQRRRRNGH